MTIENRARGIDGPMERQNGSAIFRVESGASIAALARYLSRQGLRRPRVGRRHSRHHRRRGRLQRRRLRRQRRDGAEERADGQPGRPRIRDGGRRAGARISRERLHAQAVRRSRHSVAPTCCSRLPTPTSWLTDWSSSTGTGRRRSRGAAAPAPSSRIRASIRPGG